MRDNVFHNKHDNIICVHDCEYQIGRLNNNHFSMNRKKQNKQKKKKKKKKKKKVVRIYDALLRNRSILQR